MNNHTHRADHQDHDWQHSTLASQDEKSPRIAGICRSAQYRDGEDHCDDNDDLNDSDDYYLVTQVVCSIQENEDEEDDIIIRMMLMFQDDAKVMVACLYIGIGFFGYLKFGPAVEPVSSY